MYYLMIENGNIIGASQALSGGDVIDVEVTEELYNDYRLTPNKYMAVETEVEVEVHDYDEEGEQAGSHTETQTSYEIVLNPNYEQEEAQRERQRLDALTLTPADVERALYRAKGMDFEDLKALIAQQIPSIDIKGLAIEFRAKDFYRGAEANGMRLFDVVGALLGYTPQDMDYLFENKELPGE